MLQAGDLVPHFTVKTLHGDEFSYLTIWQRRNLVLIALPVTDWSLPEAMPLNWRPVALTSMQARLTASLHRTASRRSPALLFRR